MKASQKDVEKFARLEEKIIGFGGSNSFSDFPQLPFKNYSQIINAIKSGAIGIICKPNNFQLSGIVLKRSEYFGNIYWTLKPVLLGIASVILALINHNWFYLFGIPAVIIGAFISLSDSFLGIAGLAGLAFVASFFYSAWLVTFIAGSLFCSFIFIDAARRQLQKSLIERVCESEIFFCYFYKNGYFEIFDNTTKQLIR